MLFYAIFATNDFTSYPSLIHRVLPIELSHLSLQNFFSTS